MLRTLDLLASDPSHLPFLYVFKESNVMEKYGYEIDLHVVGGPKAPTMGHRAKLALAGEIDFLSGLHHETYRCRARGEKRLTYLAQAQNNWDDRLVADPKVKTVADLKGKKIVCHSKAPCVAGNLRAVYKRAGSNLTKSTLKRSKSRRENIWNSSRRLPQEKRPPLLSTCHSIFMESKKDSG